MINDRLHDKVQQLANGELEPRDEAAVRAEIARNPEAQALLSQYSQLRSDMHLLQDVPPDQLSKERLRARLLGEALKPERPAPLWQWMWMPTMAAALAFVIYFNRTKPNEMPTVVGSGMSAAAPADSMKPSDRVAMSFPAPKSAPSPVAGAARASDGSASGDPMDSVATDVATASYEESPAGPAVRRASRGKHHGDRSHRDSGGGILDTATEFGRDALTAMATIPTKSMALSQPGDSAEESHSKDSVVVISNNVDADTGAQHATEETASNVLVGG